MKEYTKEQIDEMREILAESEFEGLTDRDLKQVLWDGCIGSVSYTHLRAHET